MENYHREIKTLEQVEEVLNSPQKSWTESVDCLEVCIEAIKDPSSKDHSKVSELLDKSQEIAIELIPTKRNNFGINRMKPLGLKKIAHKFKTIDEIPDLLEESKKFLEELKNKTWNRPTIASDRNDDWYENRTNSIGILLRDVDQAASAIKLSSYLRQEPFEQPYLSIDLCQRVLKNDPENTSALSSCAAALVDISNFPEAERLLDELANLERVPTPYQLIPRSRFYYYRGKDLRSNSDLEEAMNLAKKAANIRLKEFNNSPDEEAPSVDLLYALQWLKIINVSIDTPDHAEVNLKIERLTKRAIKSIPKNSDNIYLVLTGIENEAKTGDAAVAESLLLAFKENDPKAAEDKNFRIRKIEKEIAHNRKRQQQQFDLGNQPF